MQLWWVMENATELIEDALAVGEDINALYHGSQSLPCTLLLKAVQKDNPMMVRFLLDKGANPNVGDPLNVTPLYQAARNASIEIAQMLLDKKAFVNVQKNSTGCAPLHQAVENNDYEMVDLLLGAGADIDLSNAAGFTGLMVACVANNWDMAIHLLDKGANPNIVTPKGLSPLKCAIFHKKENVIDQLLEAGANPNVTNEMFKAVESQDVNILQNMLEHKGNLYKRGKNWTFPLLEAMNYPDFFPTLQKYAINWEATGKNNNSLLQLCALAGNVEACRFLVENNLVDITKMNDWGENILFQAVRSGSDEITRLFIEHGVSVHCVNNKGNGLFCLAVHTGNPSMVNLLLTAGIDPYASKKETANALKYMVGRNKTDLLTIALPYLKQDCQKWSYFRSKMIRKALKYERREIFDILLDGQDINTAINRNKRLLIDSIGLNEKQYVQQLLEWGANPNVVIGQNKTALDLARKVNAPEIEKLLLEYEAVSGAHLRAGGMKSEHQSEPPRVIVRAKDRPDAQQTQTPITTVYHIRNT